MPRPQLPNETRDRLLNDSLSSPPIFTSANFSCFLNRASLRFLRDGELSVSFLIPAESVNDALSLRHLAANPLPLTVIVQVNEDYLNDVEESENRLRAL